MKKQKCAQGQRKADIAEIQKLDELTLTEPESHGDYFKYRQQQNGNPVFLHRKHLRFKKIIAAARRKDKKKIAGCALPYALYSTAGTCYIQAAIGNRRVMERNGAKI